MERADQPAEHGGARSLGGELEEVLQEALDHFGIDLKQGTTLNDLASAVASVIEGVWLNQCLTTRHPAIRPSRSPPRCGEAAACYGSARRSLATGRRSAAGRTDVAPQALKSGSAIRYSQFACARWPGLIVRFSARPWASQQGKP